jgi:uncharacterized heparinase superfamily protein
VFLGCAVYTLIGLARTYGSDPVEQACAAAPELDVISVGKIKSIVEKGTGKQAAQAAARSRRTARRSAPATPSLVTEATGSSCRARAEPGTWPANGAAGIAARLPPQPGLHYGCSVPAGQ